jgi:hypothetical protein
MPLFPPVTTATFKALIGVAYVPASPDWQESARRLVDILITGSRPIK